ncbi:unnamed protein product [Brassica oleracea]
MHQPSRLILSDLMLSFRLGFAMDSASILLPFMACGRFSD